MKENDIIIDDFLKDLRELADKIEKEDSKDNK